MADRRSGDWLLRIDDTDPARNVPGGEEAIVGDLRWLGVEVGRAAGAAERAARAPSQSRGGAGGSSAIAELRRSGRLERYRRARRSSAPPLRRRDLLREDGTATYHLASVVDDVDFGITHVVRGNDHRPSEALHRRLHGGAREEPPDMCSTG